MKLITIRKAVAELEALDAHTRSQFWAKLFGHKNNLELQRLREFLRQFSDKKDKYALSSSEVFQLVNYLGLESKSNVINSYIFRELKDSQFFELLKTLKAHDLLDEEVFISIYFFQHAERQVLNDILIAHVNRALPLSKNILSICIEERDSRNLNEELKEILLLNYDRIKTSSLSYAQALVRFCVCLRKLQYSLSKMHNLIKLFEQHQLMSVEFLSRMFAANKLLSIIQYIEILDEYRLLTNSNLKAIFILSDKKIQRANAFAQHLHQNMQGFNQEAFDKIIYAVTSKSDSIDVEPLKIPSKMSQSKASIPTTEVRTAVESENNSSPLLKRSKTFSNNLNEAEGYTSLLGRDAFVSNLNIKTRVQARWFERDYLDNFRTSQLLLVPLKIRVSALKNALRELLTLHNQYRVHGDIRPENVKFDHRGTKLILLENTSSKIPIFETHELQYTHRFLESYVNFKLSKSNQPYLYNFCDDIYSMGIVTAVLFPEYFLVNSDEDNMVIPLPASLESYHGHALRLLVNSMTNNKRHLRAVCLDVYQYVTTIIKYWDELDFQSLKEICDATFHRSQITIDDILHADLSTMSPRF